MEARDFDDLRPTRDRKRRARRASQHREVAALKRVLTPLEVAWFEGPGTRTFAREALRWQAPDGVVHACEAAETVTDLVLVWTLCEIDVPAGVDYGCDEACYKCARVLWGPDTRPSLELYKPRP